MSYLVLARKYRPTTFAEVAGQDVVTRTLRGAIAEERVGHAYLFFGPRGTGKTTSARLFAKALNCENGPTAEPCGTCDRCLSYDAGTEPDLIEIDAASNTGVDHVRNLRDQAGYVPLKARFKVFLIDEVHMLSKAAFNALLKTLEEPPPHVKFLFATTELHKVPDTVSSRCQVLRLSPLSEEEIRGRLDEVFQLEGIDAEAGVTSEIARRARGGMRDALSLADQLLALVGRTPTVADTERLAGEGSTEAIEAVLDAILANDKPSLLSALPGREGDEPAFLDAVLDYVRAAMLLAMIGEDAPMLAQAASPEARANMSRRASAFGAARIELLLQELLHARERMGPIHMRAHARLILETTLLDLCRSEATMPIETIIARLEALEGRGPQSVAPQSLAPQAASPQAVSPQSVSPQSNAPQPAAPRGIGQPSAASAPRPSAPQRSPQQAPDAKTPYIPPNARPGSAPAGGAAREPASDAAAKSAEPPLSQGGPAMAPLPERQITPAAPPPGAQPRERSQGQSPQPPPPSQPQRGSRQTVAPTVQTNSTQDRWNGFLQELSGRSGALAQVIERKGKLVRDSGGTAPLKLHDLTDKERAMVDDTRSRRAVDDAFRAANGDAIRVKLEIHDSGGPKSQDAFTEHVRELFNGRVED